MPMILRPFPLRDRLWQQPGTSYLPSLLAAETGERVPSVTPLSRPLSDPQCN